jgi:electron transfer flavoprotein alpha subunit
MVLAFVEHDGQLPTETSLEMLTLARELSPGTDDLLDAAVFGEVDPGLVDELAAYGVTDVHRVEHDRLDSYAPRAWAESIDQLVDELDPDAVLTAGTDSGHEVLAHVAALRNVTMAANCLTVEPGDEYRITRQRWGGSLVEHARLGGEPKLLSVAPHERSAEPAPEPSEAVTHAFAPDLDDAAFQVRVTRFEESDVEGVPLSEARVVVGGGRGVGNAENFDKLEELADLLGGTVGSSRAAVNEGWRPHDDQIGLTGAKISPDIYVACGISGAVQHMVGCKGADKLLAINNDAEAAIMQKADYAILGDLHEVVPALSEAVRDALDGD